MDTKPLPVEPELIACEICFREIPDTTVLSEEGEDYVLHFCGLECYAAWKEKNSNAG